MKSLSRDQIRTHYDSLGAKQDLQGYYEDTATDNLMLHAAFSEAQSIFEFGCGTGRFAEVLLSHHVPSETQYLGIDLSAKMIELTRARLCRFAPRAQAQLTNGSFDWIPSRAYDRFVSNYVFDLLSEHDIHRTLAAAYRILQPGGLLCLVSLSLGCSLRSRFVAHILSGLNRVRPSLIGGCRPLALLEFLPSSQWELRYTDHVAPWNIPSQVIVASKIP